MTTLSASAPSLAPTTAPGTTPAAVIQDGETARQR